MTLGPQFDQLQMIMTGKELKNYLVDSGDRAVWANGVETMDQMWTRKTRESKIAYGGVHGSGVYDSLKKEGLRPGSTLRTWRNRGLNNVILLDGHHRVAAAATLEDEGSDPHYFLVEHNEPPPRPPGRG